MSRQTPNPAGWLWALGAASLVVAARWREIVLHGSEVPFLDQWWVEAKQILVPWLSGQLTVADFFRPHHEHLPFWPRLLVWLEARLLGTWDAQLQATINAGFMGAFVGVVSGWLRASLPRWPAAALTVLTIALGSLPHSWENIVWGFQAHMPLALLFVFLFLRGSFLHPVGILAWWLAQAAGLAALFTLGSMWAAPLAVLLVHAWCADGHGRRILPAGLLCLAGMILLVAVRAQQPMAGALALGPSGAPQFIAALLTHLGWPSARPGAFALVYLPALLLALRVRGSAATGPVDRTALALALWAAAQAAAFALARGSYVGFVSRYGDLLAVGLVANGVACWRLWQGRGPRSGWSVAALGVAWGSVVGPGLYDLNSQGHTRYFHEHSAARAELRREAVRGYLATHDVRQLDTAAVRALLFPDPARVAQILDHPGLAALLPASVQPSPVGEPLGARIARRLRDAWPVVAWSGGFAWLAAVWWSGRNPNAQATVPPFPAGDRGLAAGCGILAAVCGLLLFLWPKPFEFRPSRRWSEFLNPVGTVTGLSFHFTGPSTFPDGRLTGAAALWPEDFRNTFFGTHLDGPAFTGTAASSAFPLESPWYVVPVAGFPASAGNAVTLQIENPKGQVLRSIPCPGPNPGSGEADVGFWAVDVRADPGMNGRLVLQDQRADGEGWVAAAPPQAATDGPAAAARQQRGWSIEGTLAGLQSLQVAGLVFLLVAVGTAAGNRLARRHRS